VLKAIAGKVYRLGDEPGPRLGGEKWSTSCWPRPYRPAAGRGHGLQSAPAPDPDRTYEVITNSAGSS